MFKNLAKKHVEKYKEKRAEKRDPTVAERRAHYSPLRLYLHSTMEIFTADWVLMEGVNPGFEFPKGEMDINAIGKMPFGDGVTCWRIYLEDSNDEEFILTLLESDDEIGDAILLKQVATIVPSTQAQLDRFTTQIGFKTLETDSGEVYDRESGDEWTEKVDFHDNEYKERFIEESGVQDFINQYIIYSRKIESGEKEWFFVGLEEGDEFGELAFQAGYKVDVPDIEVR